MPHNTTVSPFVCHLREMRLAVLLQNEVIQSQNKILNEAQSKSRDLLVRVGATRWLLNHRTKKLAKSDPALLEKLNQQQSKASLLQQNLQVRIAQTCAQW